MTKDETELRQKLSAPLPDKAITPHPTKTYLKTIKAIYVTERLTEVFGVGKWSTKISVEHTNFETGMIVVKVVFEVKERDIYYECFGGNDNGGAKSKGFDLGDAYKGATTDALTKIGSYLGVGIDVYKGKHGNTPKKPYPPKKVNANKSLCDKPLDLWLTVNSDGWKAIIAAIVDGKITMISEITKQRYEYFVLTKLKELGLK